MDTNRQHTESYKDSMQMADEFTEELLLGQAGTESYGVAVDNSLLDWSLAQLIRDLSETLLPIEPSTAFVEDLKERLIASHVQPAEHEKPSPQVRGQWIRTVMSMFTIIGIASRVIGAVVLLTAILLKRRRQASPA